MYEYSINRPQSQVCFHGTTSKGLKAILKGTGEKPCAPWSCSAYDSNMYVWPLLKSDYSEECTVVGAFESAQIQAIVSEDYTLFVLELDIPTDLLYDDESCENMTSSSSCLYMQDFNVSMIRRVYTSERNKWESPYIVAHLLLNEHFNICAVDEQLLAIAEVLQDTPSFERLDVEYYDCTDTYRMLLDTE